MSEKRIQYRKISVVYITTIILGLIVMGCTDSNSSNQYTEDSSEDQSALDTNTVEAQEDSIVDTVTCLNISFIESLESGWTNGYANTRLAEKGFSYQSTRNIENGEEKTFENHALNTQLKLAKIEFPDRETLFIATYQVTADQLTCFEEGLTGTGSLYAQTSKGIYSKKGLGSYAEKQVSCDSESLWITYKHRIGKELQLPEIRMDADTLNGHGPIQ